jgi:hypothetical protein
VPVFVQSGYPLSGQDSGKDGDRHRLSTMRLLKRSPRAASLVALVLVGATGVAIAQTHSPPPEGLGVLQQQALENSNSRAQQSAGVLVSDCPNEVVGAMEAAGMPAPSSDDHIYPDCNAASALINAWKQE